MKCLFCGAEIEDGVTVCPFCEKPIAGQVDEAAEAVEEATEEAVEEAAEAAENAEETAEEAEEAIAEIENSVEEAAEEASETAEEAVEAVEEAAEEASEAVSEEANVIAEAATKAAEPAKKNFPLLAVILCGLAACAAVALIIFGPKLIASLKKPSYVTDPESDGGALTDISAYAVQDVEVPEDPRMAQMIAKCGESQLTNADLQILYRMQYDNFMYYAPYYAMYGMEAPDESIPMSEQVRTEDGLTWEQYFLKSALDYGNELLAAQEEGQKNGFALDAETQKTIDELAQTLETEAVEAGFDSALPYIQDGYGTGVGVESFVSFYKLYAYANSYEQNVYENLDCSDDQVNEFFDNNPDVMASNGISKEAASVRHILFRPADEDADGTSTEEEWAAAEAKAKEIYDKYLEDPTEDHFAELAGEYTEDPGSKETGGLYEDVIAGQMVQEFNDWVFDEARKEGDSDIVKTDYGYHIMLFLSRSESSTWFDQCKQLLLNDLMTAEIGQMKERNPMKVWYNAIVLDDVQKAAEDAETTTELQPDPTN